MGLVRQTMIFLAMFAFGATYGRNKEELILDEYCTGSKKALHRLAPGYVVKSDVIDLVVGMLSDENDSLTWFLSTIFSQIAFHPLEYDDRAIYYMRDRYMGKYENVRKV
ncbi:hypothetical protein PIB30_040949 [Stylosanthes scabra]|uniref:Uncharacterized protein n=1 Tax=Stylosanthes scabra TaxID=79078 RepID=A0ABU6REW3_9FABA|nr:hypothetical protein [Stylosanthes scabra]